MPDQPLGPDAAAVGQIAEAIRRLLQQELKLDTRTLDFVAATFGDSATGHLPQLIADESNPERDTLLDLIFYPDEDYQKRLEPVLQKYPIESAQVEDVGALLMDSEVKVRLTGAGWPQQLELTMPTDCVMPFVERLKMARTLPVGLGQTVRAFATASWQSAVAVKLRNALFAYSPQRVSFLEAFIEKVFSEQPEAWEFWDWLLALMAEHREPQNLLDFFIHKGHCYRAALQLAQDHRHKMQSSNREMLILQGVRPPHVHEAEIMRQLTWVQTILIKIFAQPPTAGDLPVARDLGQLNPETEIDSIIGLMS
jgi:hypothetical protein